MRRREFITLLGGAAAAWPLAARAQQPAKRYRIGMLETISPALNAAQLDAFRSGLRELGYVEGQTYAMEYRSADGYANRFPELAAELVRLGVDLIVVKDTGRDRRQKCDRDDSRGHGVGGRTASGRRQPRWSGPQRDGAERFRQRNDHQTSRVNKRAGSDHFANCAVCQYEQRGCSATMGRDETAARSLGIEAELLDVRNLDDVGRAFETASGRHVDALLVSLDGLFQANARMIVELVARNRLPAIYVGREFIEAGGLMTYGVSFPHLYFRAATYVDKIFRGVKPADLPIEQPTKFELVINLKTAKTLGLDVPPTLLARADEVIE